MVELDASAVQGRMIAAARMFAGLDQTELARSAGVSPATISNVESGRDVRDDTLKSVRRALRQRGVTLSLDKTNGLALVGITFVEPDVDEE